jgi:hypothetical protein
MSQVNLQSDLKKSVHFNEHPSNNKVEILFTEKSLKNTNNNKARLMSHNRSQTKDYSQ